MASPIHRDDSSSYFFFFFLHPTHTHKCSSISGVLWPSHLHHASHLIHVGIVSRPFKPAKHGDKRRKKNPHSLFTSPHAASSSRGDSDVGSAFYLNACRQLQRASWRLKDTFIRLPACCCCCCVRAGLFNFLCVCVCAQKRAEERERKKEKNWITEGETCCIIPQHHSSDITHLSIQKIASTLKAQYQLLRPRQPAHCSINHLKVTFPSPIERRIIEQARCLLSVWGGEWTSTPGRYGDEFRS